MQERLHERLVTVRDGISIVTNPIHVLRFNTTMLHLSLSLYDYSVGINRTRWVGIGLPCAHLIYCADVMLAGEKIGLHLMYMHRILH